MRLLLDTHAFIWFANSDPQLSDRAKGLIENADNDIFLSAASLWEMAIKVSLGKLHIAQPFGIFIIEQMRFNDFSLLPITVAQIALVTTLPFHHRDPFDRLLIAQAAAEQFPIVSRDEMFDLYSVQRLW